MKNDIENQEDGADGDGGVGNIEGWPGIENLKGQEAQPDFEEIGDRPVDDAVRKIARSSAQQQSEADGVDAAGVAAGDEQPGDQGDDEQRTHDEKDARGHTVGIGEEAEGDAGIFGVDDAE